MTDERFEQLMRDAAQTYNTPPADPPLDDMWAEIQQELGSGTGDQGENGRPFLVEKRRRSLLAQPWLRMAAVLVVGVAVGRVSVSRVPSATTETAEVTPVEQVASPAPRMAAHNQAAMNDYLGETAALLISLPSELSARNRDSIFVSRAGGLLLRTRLLMDSPAASDPALRSLFEDLEVVLAQVVRLKPSRDQMEVDMLTQALQQRDVLPRLRDAVADHIAN
jgi:hypothetical protein